MGANRKTLDCVQTEGQGKLHIRAKVRNYDRKEKTNFKNIQNTELLEPGEQFDVGRDGRRIVAFLCDSRLG